MRSGAELLSDRLEVAEDRGGDQAEPEPCAKVATTGVVVVVVDADIGRRRSGLDALEDDVEASTAAARPTASRFAARTTAASATEKVAAEVDMFDVPSAPVTVCWQLA